MNLSEINYISAIVFFCKFITIVCYESYHIVESDHVYKTFTRYFILRSQILLMYFGFIICMCIEKFIIKFSYDPISEQTIMKIKNDEKTPYSEFASEDGDVQLKEMQSNDKKTDIPTQNDNFLMNSSTINEKTSQYSTGTYKPIVVEMQTDDENDDDSTNIDKSDEKYGITICVTFAPLVFLGMTLKML